MISPRPRSAQTGFSLIEVMISVVILAFGVLAMGGLQLASMRSNQMAGYVGVANTLAKDYTEMMRSNPSISTLMTTTGSVNTYLFDSANTSSYASTVTTGLCVSNTCTAANLALLHVADWAARVKAGGVGGLPGARAVVCIDSDPRNTDGSFKWTCNNSGDAIVIKLGWQDKRDTLEKGTTSFALNNPQVVLSGVSGAKF